MSIHVVHANWSNARLHLWAEASEPGPALSDPAAPGHPMAAGSDALRAWLTAISPDAAAAAQDDRLVMLLPTRGERPVPSPRFAHAAGAAGDGQDGPARLERYQIATISVDAERAPAVLEAVEEVSGDEAADGGWAIAGSVEFFAAAGRFVGWLMAQQRLVPTLVQDFSGSLRGLWQPWLADEFVSARLSKLLAGMPASARSAVDSFTHEPWPMLEDFLTRCLDAQCRVVMRRENMVETIESRRALAGPGGAGDPHVQWLGGLLEAVDAVPAVGAQRPEMLKRVRGWIGLLDQRGSDSAWRLCLKLSEPLDVAELADLEAPGPGLLWTLSFHLQSVENPSVLIDARDIWVLRTEGANVGGRHVDKPQELLLKELGRAARLFKPLEDAMTEAEPTQLDLSTVKAYDFLREVRPVLIEQGVGVQAPEWWDQPQSRLGVRLRIDSPAEMPALGPGSAGGPRVGLETLVNYHWQITIGQTTLSLQEFEKLASLRTPLVLIGGRWVEVRPEDVRSAVQFIRENPGGQMEVGKALRLAYAADVRDTGVPVLGMDATGWIGKLLSDPSANQTLPILTPPDSFVGSLRPYQLKGLSWLSFLDRFGLGACLADDMGLGKTIQLLAMLLHERLSIPKDAHFDPTLLIVPMSVVGNWVREAHRFGPSLRVHVHHGPDRLQGAALRDKAGESDLVVTTYALAHRDRASLEPIGWGRIALDEAQNIKNPGTKQTQAIRAFTAPRRVALTGTPIENRLSELWSIMDFLNPGILGGVGDFRRRFALPIEKFLDQHRAKQLRGLVQPFVLRRLKTDPTVIADLPEKVETKEFCYLTPEQASLYETAVKEMLSSAEDSDGIQRRGVILAGLVRLKQICNHPAQYLKHHDPALLAQGDADVDGPGAAAGDGGGSATAPPDLHRSGKCVRLVEMLDEVVASGGQALVFTQFRQMGTILQRMLRHELDREILFLHGGTSARDREAMVAAFQKSDGSAPVFILSLKAGGVGLNLTGANHVFHFDRWWNPAVESQATDRAYRIGQTKTVQVHKFVVSGTLEERIDQMIELKSNLADNVIGSGEQWLTELSLSQLRDVLTLRPDAVEVE